MNKVLNLNTRISEAVIIKGEILRSLRLLRMTREDIRDLTGIKLNSDLETGYELLPSKIGSPLSITSLARDLKVAYNSISQWLSTFGRRSIF